MQRSRYYLNFVRIFLWLAHGSGFRYYLYVCPKPPSEAPLNYRCSTLCWTKTPQRCFNHSSLQSQTSGSLLYLTQLFLHCQPRIILSFNLCSGVYRNRVFTEIRHSPGAFETRRRPLLHSNTGQWNFSPLARSNLNSGPHCRRFA